MSHQVIIIGSGPAGLTAAMYTARGNLQPLVITGVEWGGQLMLTSAVENYPGFVDGINGPDLMDIMKKQAEKFGTEFISGNVTSVDFSTRPFKIFVGDKKDINSLRKIEFLHHPKNNVKEVYLVGSMNDWNQNTFWDEPWGKSGVHKGIDIFAKEGTPVLSSTDGVVIYKGKFGMGTTQVHGDLTRNGYVAGPFFRF